MGFNLNELVHSLSEYQMTLKNVNFAQDEVLEIRNNINRLMLSIAAFSPDPMSLEKKDTAENFEIIKQRLEALNVSMARGLRVIGSGEGNEVLKTYLAQCLKTTGIYYEHFHSLQYDENKSIYENFADVNITVKAHLKDDSSRRGALNVWKPIKFTTANGKEKKGFFTPNTHDNREEYEQALAVAMMVGATDQVQPFREGRINKRNELATLLADSLEMDYVARSTPMYLQDDNGNFVEGTLSETVTGTDIKHLKPHDPLIGCIYNDNVEESLKAFSHPAFLKQLADTQVYDYLMFNTDRSPANMFYNVDYDQNGKPFVSGVNLIDNDLSYFAKKADHCQAYMVIPEQMRAISSSMAEKVLNLNTKTYIAQMASKDITPDQMRDALERLENMKNHIKRAKENPEQGVFKILSDDDFAKLSIKDFKDHNKFPVSQKGITLESPRDKVTVFDRVYDMATRKYSLFANPASEAAYMEKYNMPVQPGEDEGIQYNSGEIVEEKPILSADALIQYKTALSRTFEEFNGLRPDPAGGFDIMMRAYNLCKNSIDKTIANAPEGNFDAKDLRNLNTAIASLNAQVSTCLNENNERELSQENAMRDKLFKKALSLPAKADDVAIHYGNNDPSLGASGEEKKYLYHKKALENLKKIRKTFKKEESIFVHSSDKYTTLQENLKGYIALAEQSLNLADGGASLKMLDTALENVIKSADDYVEVKIQKEAKKRTDRGQERLKIVADMKKQELEAMVNSGDLLKM